MNFTARIRKSGGITVQPRMGFSRCEEMQRGLQAVRECDAYTVGTITVDSFTRQNQYQQAECALANDKPLNGFPIVTYGAARTREMIRELQTEHFPIQVRHGSAKPFDILSVVKTAGIDATEGGPISYCLPYSRVPLKESIYEWQRSCEMLSDDGRSSHTVHLETFGGCLLGQLCPPSLLIAVSILEAIFFIRHGVYDVSLSYAQQTSLIQDTAAVTVLRQLAGKYLRDVDWHVVVYTYMGVYPNTPGGVTRLLAESVLLAKLTGSERLIVKTEVEARRIPGIQENVESLEFANKHFQKAGMENFELSSYWRTTIMAEADAIIQAVLNLHHDLPTALALAFRKGVMDIPFCLHPDNGGLARCTIDDCGFLCWAEVGNLPVENKRPMTTGGKINPFEFLKMLSFMADRFDNQSLRQGP